MSQRTTKDLALSFHREFQGSDFEAKTLHAGPFCWPFCRGFEVY